MKKITFFTYILSIAKIVLTDFPCATRHVNRASDRVICVCNSTYCDTITREEPSPGTFISYTSSQAGSRFVKRKGKIEHFRGKYGKYKKVFKLEPSKTYQTIYGFGGAATESAGVNWQALPAKSRKKMTESYFSRKGLEYNFIRVPIGASDFSPQLYYYNEFPVDDKHLTNFTYTPQDKEYKIPFIKSLINESQTDVYVIASTWTPPQWMKVNDKVSSQNRLKSDYYQTYADYHCKFVKLYEDAGIPIWGVTTTNEPINGNLAPKPFSPLGVLGWSTHEMQQWLIKNFGPTMRNCYGKSYKILALDDQRFVLPVWSTFVETSKEHLKYIDGYALHSYGNSVTPGNVVAACLRDKPDKFVITTEFSAMGSVKLGNWQTAEFYALTILDDLLNNYVGFVDWNLVLDLNGGPNWSKNYVDAPILVNATSGEFYKQPMFYVLGHFSKWVPRGSRRIHTLRQSPTDFKPNPDNIYAYDPERKDIYDHIAFITPQDTIVVIIANYGEEQDASILIGKKQIILELEAHSIVTVEFPYKKE